MRSLNSKNAALGLFTGYLLDYKTPSNLNIMWNFGSLAGLCLIIQLLTGIALAMHYIPAEESAFINIEHIMREVNSGWLLRYLHANGASFMFLMVYMHIYKAIYYGSYKAPYELVWFIGVALFFLMIMTAFLGYVLVWGQMSMWAATVITNLCSAIPIIGLNILKWILGGNSVSGATLNRFFSFHYLLPFILVGLACIHLLTLHSNGSNNPINSTFSQDNIPFHPYYTVKDIYGFFVFFLFYWFFVFFFPNVLGHPDNYIPANPLVTPAHIVPEWYLLPFYAILRSIPGKLLGVVAMLGAILVLLILPFVDTRTHKSATWRPLSYHAVIFLAFIFIFLGWLGSQPIDFPFVLLSRLATFHYFAFFLFTFPFISLVEEYLEKHIYTNFSKKHHWKKHSIFNMKKFIEEQFNELIEAFIAFVFFHLIQPLFPFPLLIIRIL